MIADKINRLINDLRFKLQNLQSQYSQSSHARLHLITSILDHIFPPTPEGKYLKDNGTFDTPAGGGVTDASFVTLAVHSGLSAERVLTGTDKQITVTDNGANNTVALSLSDIVEITSQLGILEGNTETPTKYTYFQGNDQSADITYTLPATQASGTKWLKNVDGTWSWVDLPLGFSSLADPSANTLMGWDDTDNLLKFITIGTGLTYTHSSHTLSATGGAVAGTVILLSANETPTTGNLEDNNAVMQTYNLSANSYSKIIWEAEGYITQNFDKVLDVTIQLRDDTNVIQSIPIVCGGLTLDSATNTWTFAIKGSAVVTANHDLDVYIVVANGNGIWYCNSFRVYGVV